MLQQQTDMFDPTVPDPQIADYSAFRPRVRTLVGQSRRFRGSVYLFNGDSHRFNRDRPLAAGSRWLSFYGVTRAAANLGRITVDGSDLGEADWLKVTVRPRGREPLRFRRCPAPECGQVFRPWAARRAGSAAAGRPDAPGRRLLGGQTRRSAAAGRPDAPGRRVS